MGVYSAKARKIQVSSLSDGRAVTVSLLGKRVNSDFILG